MRRLLDRARSGLKRLRHPKFLTPPPEVTRDEMVAAIKSEIIPELRARGFRGSFPHFYRDDSNFISLITFQFFSSGGSFCINIGYADPQRQNVFSESDCETNKLKVMATRNARRLGDEAGDRWFHFGRTSYGQFRDASQSVGEIVTVCNELFVSDGEQWWGYRKQDCAE